MPRTPTLAGGHDCLLLDLDGTVFRGSEPTPSAVSALAATGSARRLYVTNNASRSADDVAAHLTELGFTAATADVVTSAQSAARLLAEALSPGDPVLVVGTDALAAEVSHAGLRPVRIFDDHPRAVVQGHSPGTGWADLAEAALAIRAGALWVAANVDATLPTERGLLPGNGSMVAALRTATDSEPLVAGKPGRALIDDALARGTFGSPLVVGDRLDTDIAGANAAGLPSLMVLTGVNTAVDAIWADADHRPTYIGADLTALHLPVDAVSVVTTPGRRIDVEDQRVTAQVVGSGGDVLSLARSLAAAVWESGIAPVRRPVVADDPVAERVLSSLFAGAIH